jgi:hypothetical protein
MSTFNMNRSSTKRSQESVHVFILVQEMTIHWSIYIDSWKQCTSFLLSLVELISRQSIHFDSTTRIFRLLSIHHWITWHRNTAQVNPMVHKLICSRWACWPMRYTIVDEHYMNVTRITRRMLKWLKIFECSMSIDYRRYRSKFMNMWKCYWTSIQSCGLMPNNFLK